MNKPQFRPGNIAFLKTINFHKILCLLALTCAIFSQTTAQQVAYNLSDLAAKGLLKGENRTVSSISEKNGVRLSSEDGSGVVWLENTSFTNGTIEVDLRGRDVKQGSFLGIAFHGTSKDDCEAVYFRPFNFLAKDSLARAHMVQYALDTVYSWSRLRDEHPGVYENKATPTPNPTDWFHAKIDVQGDLIKVYVNNAETHCLQVKSLNKRNTGKIGLWVGNASPGDFANLVVQKK